MSSSHNPFAALSTEDHLEVEAEVLRGSENSNASTNLNATSSTDTENDADFTTVGRRNARASPEARAARAAADQAERDRIMASGQAKRLDFTSHLTLAQRLARQARDEQRRQEFRERQARREAGRQAFLAREAARQQHQAEFEAREAARQRQQAEHQAYLARVARRQERAEREAREKEEEEKRNRASLMDFAQPGRGQQRRR